MTPLELMLVAAASASATTSITPTTWNPADKGSEVTLSNGNLTVVTGANYDSYGQVRSVASALHTTSGLYWEITCNDNDTSELFGIATSSWAGAYNGAGFYGARRTGGDAVYKCGSGADGASGFSTVKTVGDKFMFAFKSGSLHIGVNGSWIGGSDPVANTGALWTGISGTFYAAVGDHDVAQTNITANFGASSFSYAVPSGYAAGFGA